MRITRLTADDLGDARALNAVYARAFEDADTYSANHPSDGALRRVLARDTTIVLVAKVDGEVIGGLTAYELPKLESGLPEVYLYDLAVDAPHRRRGIALALIHHLRDLAAGLGAGVIFVQADRPDTAAVALYQRFGEAEEPLHFDIPTRTP